ncbi:hypothetical protein JCM10213v2_002032 [Rhodosporidiobolus nylandii]
MSYRPSPKFCLSFPHLPHVFAWVEVDGYALQVHAVGQKGSKTVGYVEATDGKRFTVCYCDERRAGERPEASFAVRVEVDGNRVDGRIMKNEESRYSLPLTDSKRFTTIKGVEAGTSSIRPLSFSSVALTSDDSLALSNERELSTLGSIKLSYRRVKSVGEAREGERRSVATGSGGKAQLHEDAKKAVSHQATYGAEVKVKAAKRARCEYLDPKDAPLATVEFRYRSRERRTPTSGSVILAHVREEENRVRLKRELQNKAREKEREEAAEAQFQRDLQRWQSARSSFAQRTADGFVFPPARVGFAGMTLAHVVHYGQLQEAYRRAQITADEHAQLIQYISILQRTLTSLAPPSFPFAGTTFASSSVSRHSASGTSYLVQPTASTSALSAAPAPGGSSSVAQPSGRRRSISSSCPSLTRSRSPSTDAASPSSDALPSDDPARLAELEEELALLKRQERILALQREIEILRRGSSGMAEGEIEAEMAFEERGKVRRAPEDNERGGLKRVKREAE